MHTVSKVNSSPLDELLAAALSTWRMAARAFSSSAVVTL
jgi:hypothetical protein